MEVVQMEIFFLLISAIVSPLYKGGLVKRYSVGYFNRVAYLAQCSAWFREPRIMAEMIKKKLELEVDISRLFAKRSQKRRTYNPHMEPQ